MSIDDIYKDGDSEPNQEQTLTISKLISQLNLTTDIEESQNISFFFDDELMDFSEFLEKYFPYLQENKSIPDITNASTLEGFFLDFIGPDDEVLLFTYLRFLALLFVQLPTVLNLYKSDVEALRELASILSQFPLLVSSKILLDTSLRILEIDNNPSLLWTFFSTVELLPKYVDIISNFLIQNDSLYTNNTLMKIVLHLTKEVHCDQFMDLQKIVENVYKLFQEKMNNKYFVKIILHTYDRNQNLFDCRSYFLYSDLLTSADYQLLSFLIFSQYFSFETLHDAFEICIAKNDETVQSKHLSIILLIHHLKITPIEELEMALASDEDLFSSIIDCIDELEMINKIDLEIHFKLSGMISNWIAENRPEIDWNP